MASRAQSPEEILRTGISFSSRSILLCDEIDDPAVKQIWTALQILDRPDSTITLYLNTLGGYVNAGFAIYDMLKDTEAYIRIVGVGRVYSMGSVILQAGDERLLQENCSVMIHPGSAKIEETAIPVIGQELEDHKRNIRKTSAMLAERMGISTATFMQRYKGNHYFTAEQAVSLGLADRVV